jgi:hypothetical protein
MPRRTVSRMLEESSRTAFRAACPARWTVEDIRHDYGIDLRVTVFDPSDGPVPRPTTAGTKAKPSVTSAARAVRRLSMARNTARSTGRLSISQAPASPLGRTTPGAPVAEGDEVAHRRSLCAVDTCKACPIRRFGSILGSDRRPQDGIAPVSDQAEHPRDCDRLPQDALLAGDSSSRAGLLSLSSHEGLAPAGPSSLENRVHTVSWQLGP